MRNAYRTGNTARAAMTANAGTAYKLIETINTDVQQMALSDQRCEQYQAITEAKQAFMLASSEVRGYTAKSNAENARKPDRERVGQGKCLSVRVESGCRRDSNNTTST